MADHLTKERLRNGQRTAATIGRGQPEQPRVAGWEVVSSAVAVPPPHKRNLGTGRERAKRAKAPARHRAHKGGRKTKLPSAPTPRYAQTWVLFTVAPTAAQAVTAYAQRLSIEETFRDWQSSWGVRTAVSALPTEAMVERLLAVVCLAYSLQLQVGQRLSADLVGQQRRQQWTVTERISWFWCGQRVFSDPGYDWQSWLAAQWGTLSVPQVPTQPKPVSPPLLAEAA